MTHNLISSKDETNKYLHNSVAALDGARKSRSILKLEDCPVV